MQAVDLKCSSHLAETIAAMNRKINGCGLGFPAQFQAALLPNHQALSCQEENLELMQLFSVTITA